MRISRNRRKTICIRKIGEFEKSDFRKKIRPARSEERKRLSNSPIFRNFLGYYQTFDEAIEARKKNIIIRQMIMTIMMI